MDTALVRVSSNSQVKLNRVRALRAITIADVRALLSSERVDFVIFEDVKPEEVEAIKALRKDYRMPMYTFGNLQIEGINNSVSLSDLQDNIYGDTGILVKTYAVRRSPVLFTKVYDEFGEEVKSIEEKPSEEPLYLVEDVQVPEPEELIIGDYVPPEQRKEEAVQDRLPEIIQSILPVDIPPEDSTPEDETSIDISSASDFVLDFGSLTVGDEGEEDSITPSVIETVPATVVGLPTIIKDKPSTVDNEPSVTENEPSVTENEPSVTENEPSVTENEPSAVEDTPSVTDNEPSVIENEPSGFSTEPSMIEETPTTTEDTPSMIEETPTKTEDTPSLADIETSAIEETPSAIEETPSAIEETPSAIEETPSAVEETPSAVKDTPTTTDTTPTVVEDAPDMELVDGHGAEESLPDFIIPVGESNITDTEALTLSLLTELNYYKDIFLKLKREGQAICAEQIAEQHLQKLETLNQSLTAELESLRGELKIKDAQSDSKAKALEETLAEKEKLVQELTITKQSLTSVKDSYLKEHSRAENLQAESKSKDDLITLLKTTSSSNSEQVKMLGSQVESLTEQVADRESQMTELMAVVRRLGLLIDKYKGSAKAEARKAQVALDSSKKLISEKTELNTTIIQLKKQVGDSERRISETKRSYELRLGDMDTRRRELQTSLEEEQVLKAELEIQVETLTQNLETANLERDGAVELKEQLEQQIEDLNSSLSNANGTIHALQDELEELKESTRDSRQTKENLSVADETILELQKEIGTLQIRLREEQRLSDAKDKEIGTLRKQRSEAERTAAVFTRKVNVGGSVALQCKFSGRGYVLPVCGSGSYGITTTAVSMARKLFKEGASVCLVDFDMMSPKANAFFDSARVILPYREEGLQQMYCTGIGLLMVKGAAWFLDHRNDLIQTVETTRKGGKRLDYISGLQAPLDSAKFVAIDFTEFFTTLGNDYDFVIVDAGKLGANPAQDSLISMLNNISLKTTLVSLKDKNDARNLLVKSRALQLDFKKVAWFLNLATNSGKSDWMREIIGKTPNVTMPFHNNFYGELKTFGSGLTKGPFDILVEDYILNK